MSPMARVFALGRVNHSLRNLGELTELDKRLLEGFYVSKHEEEYRIFDSPKEKKAKPSTMKPLVIPIDSSESGQLTSQVFKSEP
jgi:hypothetical protein